MKEKDEEETLLRVALTFDAIMCKVNLNYFNPSPQVSFLPPDIYEIEKIGKSFSPSVTININKSRLKVKSSVQCEKRKF